MISIKPRLIRLALAGFFIYLIVRFISYTLDIHNHFPNLDLKNARMGVASWYSETDDHINKHTANGEVFDDKDSTCATWFYDFGEELLVINAFTGKWIVCRVNDRGPAKRLRREIDLTKATFSKIANLKRGLIHVFVIATDTKPKP